MGIRPLHKNIVVRPLEQPENEYGILIVQEQKKSETIGEVISCDEAVQSVAVGNKVLYARYAGSPVTIDGEELTVMHEADVLAVLG
nr:MAG TPA: co-chaperonin [Caudoviricetes sp.]